MCWRKSKRNGEIEQFISEFTVFRDKNEVAFLFGNGYDFYTCPDGAKHWDDLIKQLAQKLSVDFDKYKGLDPTEQYSSIVLDKGEDTVLSELNNINNEHIEFTSKVKELNTAFCQINIPVLTTNIDNIIDMNPDTGKVYPSHDFAYDGSKLFDPRTIMHDSMWNLNHYFAQKELKSADSGYGVWHIHGHTSHVDTIRFGLVSYAKLISRLSKHLDNISDNNWLLRNTWLNLLMKKRLCIVGLKISSVEFGLRYLLMRRCHIYKEIFGCPSPSGWYLYSKTEECDLKPVLQFMRSVGIIPVPFDNYDSIYETIIKFSKYCK